MLLITLTSSRLLNELVYTIQAHLSRERTAYSRLDPLYQLAMKKMPPQTRLQANLMKAIT